MRALIDTLLDVLLLMFCIMGIVAMVIIISMILVGFVERII